jgi:hypothetical protein
MAKVINPLMSTEARGRVGGLIANTWRGISYLKAFCSPAQPRTQRQLQMRAWNAMLMRKWQSLTPTNRTNWNDYAVNHPDIDWTGNQKRLTGLNWYLRCNIRLLDLAKPVIADPPTTPAPDAVLGLAVAGTTAGITISYTTAADTTLSTDIRRVGPHSAGKQAKIEQAKHISYQGIEIGLITESGLLPGRYTAFVRVIDEDNGLASPDLSGSATAT